MSRGIEICQKIAVWSHLLGTLTGIEKRGMRSLVWRAHGDERLASLVATQLLQVIARNQTAHAVSDHVKRRFLAPSLFDFPLQLLSERLDSHTGVAGVERRNQAVVTLFLQLAFQKKKAVTLLKNAMDQDHARRRACFTGFHRCGRECRKQCRHDPTFHEQIITEAEGLSMRVNATSMAIIKKSSDGSEDNADGKKQCTAGFAGILREIVAVFYAYRSDGEIKTGTEADGDIDAR